MGLHDLIDHGQSEAGTAFKVRLEGFEYLLRLLRRHARSGVRKAHLPVVSQAFDNHLESAAVLHGPDRVLGKVPKDLFDLVPVGEHPRLRRGKPALNRDAGIFRSHAMSDQGKSVFQQSNQVGLVEVILLAARVSQEIGDDPVQALRFPGNDIEQPAVLFAQFRYAGEHADGARDGSKRIANLVGDSRGQAAHGCQAVLHADFALQSPDLGEIIQGIDIPQWAALGHIQSGDSYPNRLTERFRRVETNLGMAARLAVRQGVEKQVGDGFSQQLSGGAFQEFLGCAIDQRNAAVETGGDQSTTDGLNYVLVQDL